MQTSYLQQAYVSAGVHYLFKVRAHNAHGWGLFSDPFEIVAAKVPEQPLAPTTAINNIFVRISWDQPYANSAPVNGYKIFVSDSIGVFALDQTYCNGLIDPVLSQNFCEIPMSVLRSSRYNLPFYSVVKA